MFPNAHSSVFYNDAGEPLGWEPYPDIQEMYEDAHLEMEYEDRFVIDDFYSNADEIDENRDYEEEQYWDDFEDE